MYKPGGPELLLYRRASAPRPPTAQPPAGPPRGARASQGRKVTASEELRALDAFAGNMLAEDSVVSAVTGFGVTAEAGDARLDPLTAPVYLSLRRSPVSHCPGLRGGDELAAPSGAGEWFDPVILNTGRYVVMGADR